MSMEKEQQELKELVRQAAEGWYEYTAKDESIIRDAQMAAIMWCVTYLWQKGHGPAGAELLAFVPEAYANRVMSETT
jgi:hypothetical protein